MRKQDKPILRRLLRAAFFEDAGLFLALGALPWRILDLGGDAVALGVVPAVGVLTHIVLTHFTGSLTLRMDRFRMIRYGLLAGVLFAAFSFKVDSLPLLMLVMPLAALGGALFRPAIRSLVDGFSDGEDACARNRGRLHLFWSLGGGLGFLAGGLLLARYGFRNAYLASIALTALGFFSIPRDTFRYAEAGDGEETAAATPSDAVATSPTAAAAAATPSDAATPPATVATPLAAVAATSARTSGRLIGFAVHGAAAMLICQLPGSFDAVGWGAARYGLLLGLVFLAQLAALPPVSDRIRYRPSGPWLTAPRLAAAAGLIALPFVDGLPLQALLVLPLGVCIGAGRRADFTVGRPAASGGDGDAVGRETLPGLGAFLLPLLGGVVVRMSGQTAAPCLIAGATLLIAALSRAFTARATD